VVPIAAAQHAALNANLCSSTHTHHRRATLELFSRISSHSRVGCWQLPRAHRLLKRALAHLPCAVSWDLLQLESPSSC
jgi:hypothetical protein